MNYPDESDIGQLKIPPDCDKQKARQPIRKSVRFEVFKRDQFICQYCGNHPPAIVLEVDHIVPVALGGGNDIDNLVAACFDCNRGKAARSLDVVPQSLAEKAAEIAEREEQLRGYHAIMESKRQRLDNEAWVICEMLRRGCDSFPRDKFNSIRMFIEKLGYHAVREAMDITLMNAISHREERLFRYFCGVCWNRIRGE